jgi:hypothetical protein
VVQELDHEDRIITGQSGVAKVARSAAAKHIMGPAAAALARSIAAAARQHRNGEPTVAATKLERPAGRWGVKLIGKVERHIPQPLVEVSFHLAAGEHCFGHSSALRRSQYQSGSLKDCLSTIHKNSRDLP